MRPLPNQATSAPLGSKVDFHPRRPSPQQPHAPHASLSHTLLLLRIAQLCSAAERRSIWHPLHPAASRHRGIAARRSGRSGATPETTRMSLGQARSSRAVGGRPPRCKPAQRPERRGRPGRPAGRPLDRSTLGGRARLAHSHRRARRRAPLTCSPAHLLSARRLRDAQAGRHGTPDSPSRR